jgi:hypothetical protein
MTDDWPRHDGRRCPVDPDTMVQVKPSADQHQAETDALVAAAYGDTPDAAIEALRQKLENTNG